MIIKGKKIFLYLFMNVFIHAEYIMFTKLFQIWMLKTGVNAAENWPLSSQE